MREARKAARRTKNVIRVYVVENPKDLERPLLKEQIQFDIQGGVNVYFCNLDDIKKDVQEPDFGIWDEDYVCYVRFDKNKKASEVILSSRKKDIIKALGWQKIILEKSFKINNLDTDLPIFLRSE